ncbi:hypothetical protein Tco_0073207 [Tanacetum coccineum]
MAELILYDNMEKAPTESNLSITSNDINIELNKEFLVELRKNIYHGTYNEDVVDHIAKSDTEKEDEQSQTKRKYSNTFNFIDEQPNKRKCKAEKFKAIQYSLGPNEEYIAIRGYEFDIWERNDDNLSIIYQDIFQKKDEGWKVTRTKTLEAKNIDEYWWRIYKSGDLEVLES